MNNLTLPSILILVLQLSLSLIVLGIFFAEGIAFLRKRPSVLYWPWFSLLTLLFWGFLSGGSHFLPFIYFQEEPSLLGFFVTTSLVAICIAVVTFLEKQGLPVLIHQIPFEKLRQTVDSVLENSGMDWEDLTKNSETERERIPIHLRPENFGPVSQDCNQTYKLQPGGPMLCLSGGKSTFYAMIRTRGKGDRKTIKPLLNEIIQKAKTLEVKPNIPLAIFMLSIPVGCLLLAISFIILRRNNWERIYFHLSKGVGGREEINLSWFLQCSFTNQALDKIDLLLPRQFGHK